ncbi:MAG: MBL fold metallo-hydrolase [Actinomycetota bacterium]|nr:MBL fold metallo-hydrolase [Actinomycetota bacterium]
MRRVLGKPRLVVKRVAEGIEVLRVRAPGRLLRETNIYLLEADGRVIIYETGTVFAANAIHTAAAERGGIRQVVLSHAHADHRGGAARLNAPIVCHPQERPVAEGDGWANDGFDYSKISNPLMRAITPLMLKWMDGGPLQIAGTLQAGDWVAGFQILHLPGHTPGQIGLWREADRLAIVSDAVFVSDPFSLLDLPGSVRLPPPPGRPDDAAARESVHRIAALNPATVWLGHYGPITRNVRAELERAADGD